MRIAFCDDNENEINRFCEMIISVAKKQGMYVEIDKYVGGERLIYKIQEASALPDAIFLDINMPDIKGIDVAQKLKEMGINVPIVFLTVSDKHFLQAFDVQAFNYILKNQQPEKRIKRILKQLAKKMEWEDEDFILLTVCGEQTVIPLNRIYYFESNDKIIHVHYKDNDMEFYSTLRKIEEELFGKGFMRVHRSFLVATSAIVSYSRKSMLLKNGDRIPIGRSYYNRVKEKILLG